MLLCGNSYYKWLIHYITQREMNQNRSQHILKIGKKNLSCIQITMVSEDISYNIRHRKNCRGPPDLALHCSVISVQIFDIIERDLKPYVYSEARISLHILSRFIHVTSLTMSTMRFLLNNYVEGNKLPSKRVI